MPFEDTPSPRGWSAHLDLAFALRDARTVLARRAHVGPLHVQKALYPEGERVCHAILVHPPGGIADGDALSVAVDAGPGAHVLITTPGAAKWYRSIGGEAAQAISLRAGAGSIVEWLPQESIVFDAACARMSLDVELAGDAAFIGLDVLCLGRPACGERFTRGRVAVATAISRDGQRLWLERGALRGDDPRLGSPVGWDGTPVLGTLLVAAPDVDADLRDACREVRPSCGRGAVTLLPGVLVARYLGPSCEPARAWLAALWAIVRPALAHRPAVAPRIWST